MFSYIFGGAEEKLCGRISLRNSGELSNIRLMCFNFGPSVVGETAQIKIYPANKKTGIFTQSNAVDLTLLEQNFVGLLRFDFSRIQIRKNLVYDFYLSLSGYSRNDTRFFSVIYDYPNPTYELSTETNKFLDHPIKHEVFTYEL